MKRHDIVRTVLKEFYSERELRDMMVLLFPTPEQYARLVQKTISPLGIKIHPAVAENFSRDKNAQALDFARNVRSLDVSNKVLTNIVGPILNTLTGATYNESPSGFPQPPSKSKLERMIEEYASTVDMVCVSVTEELKILSYSELYKKVQDVRTRKGTSEFEMWKWSLSTRGNRVYEILGVILAEKDMIQLSSENLAKDILSMIEPVEKEHQKALKIAEKESFKRLAAERQSGSLERQNSAMVSELKSVKDAYAMTTRRVEELETELKNSKGSDAELIRIELELIQGEFKEVTDLRDVAITENGELSHQLRGVKEENDDLKAKVFCLEQALLSDDDVAEVEDITSERRAHYTQEFKNVGMDFTIVEALFEKGFKRLKARGEAYLNKDRVLGNTMARLDSTHTGEYRMNDITRTVEECIRAGGILAWKGNSCWSVNPNTRVQNNSDASVTGGVMIPILREYIAESLERESKLRTTGIVREPVVKYDGVIENGTD